MKFCDKCGKEIMDQAVVCPNCGSAVKGDSPVKVEVPKSAKNAKILGILSIVILAPLGIPGIILANKSKNETGGVMCKQAKTGLICSIIGLCLWGVSLLMLLGGM